MNVEFAPPIRIKLLVACGYFSPTPLQLLWGPWINRLTLLSKN